MILDDRRERRALQWGRKLLMTGTAHETASGCVAMQKIAHGPRPHPSGAKIAELLSSYRQWLFDPLGSAAALEIFTNGASPDELQSLWEDIQEDYWLIALEIQSRLRHVSAKRRNSLQFKPPPVSYSSNTHSVAADAARLCSNDHVDWGLVARELKLIRNLGGPTTYDSLAQVALLRREIILNDDQIFVIASAAGNPLGKTSLPVYDSIARLVDSFHFSGLGSPLDPGKNSKQRLDHAREILTASRNLLAQLRGPETGDLPWHDDVRIAQILQLEEIVDEYEWLTAKLVARRDWWQRHRKSQKSQSQRGESLLEAFINGPLAVCYHELTGRTAAAGWDTRKRAPMQGRCRNRADGAFIRFALTLFDQVGFRVSGQTINRALSRRSN